MEEDFNVKLERLGKKIKLKKRDGASGSPNKTDKTGGSPEREIYDKQLIYPDSPEGFPEEAKRAESKQSIRSSQSKQSRLTENPHQSLHSRESRELEREEQRIEKAEEEPEPYIALKETRNQMFKDTMAAAKKTNVIDSVVNREHKVKDSFATIFPSYRIYSNKTTFKSTNQAVNDEIVNPLYKECVDKTFHNKNDSIKRYTEEMLKAMNMKSEKK